MTTASSKLKTLFSICYFLNQDWTSYSVLFKKIENRQRVLSFWICSCHQLILVTRAINILEIYRIVCHKDKNDKALKFLIFAYLCFVLVVKMKLETIYSYIQIKWHPYLISTIEMRSLWTEIKYIKSAARLLDRDWVNKGGLDLSKKVL